MRCWQVLCTDYLENCLRTPAGCSSYPSVGLALCLGKHLIFSKLTTVFLFSEEHSLQNPCSLCFQCTLQLGFSALDTSMTRNSVNMGNLKVNPAVSPACSCDRRFLLTQVCVPQISIDRNQQDSYQSTPGSCTQQTLENQ